MQRLSENHLKQFGRNIATLRVAGGWTQEQLAEKTGISWRYLQSIEAGKRWPSIIVLLRLKGALVCQWVDFFAGVE